MKFFIDMHFNNVITIMRRCKREPLISVFGICSLKRLMCVSRSPFSLARFSANFWVVGWWTTAVGIYHCGNISRGAPSVAINAYVQLPVLASFTFVNAIRSVSQIDARDHSLTCINLINGILIFVLPRSCEIVRMNITEIALLLLKSTQAISQWLWSLRHKIS